MGWPPQPVGRAASPGDTKQSAAGAVQGRRRHTAEWANWEATGKECVAVG